MWNYDQAISWFREKNANRLLQLGTWGIEREAQRITADGHLALSDHPAKLGNKLDNPRITTDFAESQLEMITPPCSSIEKVLAELEDIHHEVEAALHEEYLWPFSMPPRLPQEELIPIARYDDSPAGRANMEYRKSLAERYGKRMQMISGLHLNFSFHPELIRFLAERSEAKEMDASFRDSVYFAMARNFLRYRWLLIYLFGASPVADISYTSVISDELSVVDQCCPSCRPDLHQYERYATSLRVSRYGYSNTNQPELMVSFSSLAEHVASFRKLLGTMLQNERELYAPIRLKPRIAKGETYLEALDKRGVEYAEVRLIDLNPFIREGVSLQQLRVFHTFLLWCVLEESPSISPTECAAIHENHHKVSLFGRKPRLRLRHYTKGQLPMTVWMEEIFEKLKEVAMLLDQACDQKGYQAAIEEEYEKVHDTERILAARIVAEMKQHQETFLEYGVRLAKRNLQICTTGGTR